MNKKIAIFSDISCYGKCSTTSIIPILSAFGDICSVNFDSYLSSNVKYTDKTKYEVSKNFVSTIDMWNKNNFIFDGIITGYINDANNIKLLYDYISNNKLENNNTLTLVDPVFADDGEKYCTITYEHIINYRKLIKIADIITPNISEACFLADVPYNEYKDKYITIRYNKDDKEKLNELSKKIIETILPLIEKLRCKKNQITIITGIELYNAIVTILDVYDGDHKKRQTTCNYSEKIENRNGAGDLFDAMFFETCTNGFNLADALAVTTSFINNALRYSQDMKIEKEFGIVYEPILLDNLIAIRNKINELKEKKQC